MPPPPPLRERIRPPEIVPVGLHAHLRNREIFASTGRGGAKHWVLGRGYLFPLRKKANRPNVPVVKRPPHYFIEERHTEPSHYEKRLACLV